jgi:hypothetical protein
MGYLQPDCVYFTAFPNKFMTILLHGPIGKQNTQSSSCAMSSTTKHTFRSGKEFDSSSVGDTGASMSLEVTGIYEAPENTASTTSSVAILRSNAGSFLRRLLSGLDERRTVFEFFSRLEETAFLDSLILAYSMTWLIVSRRVVPQAFREFSILV